MGVPKHGFNGLVYISGAELYGANAWGVNIDNQAVETPQFGDLWMSRVVGMNDWSGNLKVWQYTDGKQIITAATTKAPVSIVLYPDRAVSGSYLYGNAIFSWKGAADTSSAIAGDADFVGSGALTAIGFA